MRDRHGVLTQSLDIRTDPVTPGLTCHNVSLMRDHNYPRLIASLMPLLPPASHCCCCCCVVGCFCPTDVVSAVAALAVDWVLRRRQVLNVLITNIPICMLIGLNALADVIIYLTETSNGKRLKRSKGYTEYFAKCMESARVWCVLYAQVCRVITGCQAGQHSPLRSLHSTHWARQQHHRTLWAVHTNNMLTGTHRYSAHHSARQRMNSFLWRDSSQNENIR